MSQFVEAFTLGNAAILSNVCLLPLYPGLMVMLAGRAQPVDGLPAGPLQRLTGRMLGVAVLAGIVTFMVVLGFVLHQVQRSVASVLDMGAPGGLWAGDRARRGDARRAQPVHPAHHAQRADRVEPGRFVVPVRHVPGADDAAVHGSDRGVRVRARRCERHRGTARPARLLRGVRARVRLAARGVAVPRRAGAAARARAGSLPTIVRCRPRRAWSCSWSQRSASARSSGDGRRTRRGQASSRTICRPAGSTRLSCRRRLWL